MKHIQYRLRSYAHRDLRTNFAKLRPVLLSPKCLGTQTSVEKNIFFGKLHSSHRTSAFVNPLIRDKFFTPIVYFNWPVIQTKPVKCSWGRYLAVICGWLWSMFKVPFRGFHWNQNSIFAEKGFRGWGGVAGGFYYISHFVFFWWGKFWSGKTHSAVQLEHKKIICNHYFLRNISFVRQSINTV